MSAASLKGNTHEIEFLTIGADDVRVTVWEAGMTTVCAVLPASRARTLYQRGRFIGAGSLPGQSLDTWITGVADGIWIALDAASAVRANASDREIEGARLPGEQLQEEVHEGST